MNIYLAGSSQEHALVSSYIARLAERNIRVTHDWTASVRAARLSGTTDRDLAEALREQYAREDLMGVWAAPLVWLLIPEAQSVGCWIEFGAALAVRHYAGKRAIVSGDWRKTIFTSLAHQRFDTHEEAFRWVCR